MLLLSVTNSDEVSELFKGHQINEHKKGSHTITAVSDNLLSRVIHNPTGFTLLESPFALYDNIDSAIYTKIIYDEEENRITIHKPVETVSQLFYTITKSGEFYCSTHISALRKAGVPILENEAALPQLFYFGFAMPPSTLYENIYQALIGSRITIDIENNKCSVKNIDLWYPPEIDYGLNKEKAIQDISRLFDNAINNLKPCEDEIAILLSGGLDSTLILRTCQRLGFNIDKTYSAGYSFDEPNYEKEYALTAAESLGVNHEYIEPTIDQYLHGLIAAVEEAEQPLLHMQSVLIHILNKRIPESRRIIINGQYSAHLGSTGGNKQYRFSKTKAYQMLIKTKALNPVYFRLFRLLKKDNYEYLNGTLKDPNNPFWPFFVSGDMDFVSKYFEVTPFEVIKEFYNLLDNYLGRTRSEVNGIRSLYGFNGMTVFTWCKISESSQKAFYVPHNALVEYSYKIPEEIKDSAPKILKTEILRRYEIPDYIIEREKRGFNPVKTDPLIKGGIFEPLIPVASKAFDETVLREIQPKTWNWDRFWTFWHILNYSIWKRLYINNESKETLIDEIR